LSRARATWCSIDIATSDRYGDPVQTAQTVTVISKTGHHLIASHTIDADSNYWRNQQMPRPMAGAVCNQ
jgi:hypothetical protein